MQSEIEKVLIFGSILGFVSGKANPHDISNLDGLLKSHEFKYRWLSKKVHIQGVVFFQERGHTSSMPSV